jgi:tetratricopeptide (TPR) repeat protein
VGGQAQGRYCRRVTGQSPQDRAAALLAAGRPQEALLAIEAAATAPDASHTILARYASALKALERIEDCLAVRRLATQRFPQSGVAWHNLASQLGDLGAGAEAAQACEKAFAAGLDAPETWFVYGRALAGQSQLNEALTALDQAIRRRPSYGEALTQKAKLIWAVSNDADKAAAVFPDDPAFILSRAEIYRDAGDSRRALALVDHAAQRSPGDAGLLQVIAGLALELGEDDRALTAAQTALRLAPSNPISLQALATVCIAVGRADDALTAARRLVVARPFDQSAIALLAVAARLADAPDYARLYDYSAFVRSYEIAAPAGWATLGAFMGDLKATLERLHEGAAQPPEQSLRLGTQTNGDLRAIDDPVLKAFFAAIEAPIQDHIAALGPGDDPVRARNSGGYVLAGAWSNRLRSEGHHVDHIHPRGWLSSAFYVEVPPEVQAGDDRAGWLQFGRPGVRTSPTLAPAHFERPAPGKLVLFPSYMWHGTAPFTSAQTRTTIAFDVAPA